MKSKWPMVPLGDVLTQYKEYIEYPEPKIYPKLSVKLYGKGVILDSPADGTSLKMKRHQIARCGQVILSEIWGKKGAIGFVPPEGDGALCTSHFFLFDVSCNKIDQKYLKAIFTANYLQEQLDAEAKGTTGYAAVRPKILFDAKIPLPPLNEQRRIVARIEELAARIEEARELRRRAVEETAALAISSKNIFFSDDSNGLWPKMALSEVADIRSGVTLGRELNGPTIRLPYLRVANVQDGYLDLSIIKEVEVLESELQKWQLQEGDLLLTEGGDWDKLGRCAVWNNEVSNCIHQNHIFRLRMNLNVFEPEYLCALIGSSYEKKYFQAASKQTTNLASINQKQLRAFAIFRPPLQKQKQIITYLKEQQSKLDALKRHQTETAAELDALMPAVLERAFRGEL